MIVFIIAILCLFAGWFLFKRGRRGVRLDDHPHCARCTFDLLGLDGAYVCPECGLDLAFPGARTFGTFRPRPRLITCGSLLLAMGALLVADMMFGFTGRVDWYARMPLWMLERQAMGQPPLMSTIKARDELLRRAQRGLVEPQRLAALATSWMSGTRADPTLQYFLVSLAAVPTLPADGFNVIRAGALAMHADRTQAPTRELTAFLEGEMCAGRFSTTEMETYLRQSVRPKLSLVGPATCFPGERPPVIFNWNARGGQTGVLASLSLPGSVDRRTVPNWPDGLERNFGSLSFLNVYHRRHHIIASTEPGPHEINGVATISLSGSDFRTPASADRAWASFPGGVSQVPPVLLRFPITVRYTVDPSLPDTPLDRARREIMRSVSFNQGVSQSQVDTVSITVTNSGTWFRADIAITGIAGDKVVSCGSGKLVATESTTGLSLHASESHYTSSGGALAATELHLPPGTFHKLRARFFNVFLSGTPATPIDPFEFEIDLEDNEQR